MRKEKIIMTLTGIAAAFTVLSGCAAGKGADVDQEIHIAAIIGSHENAPKPNLGLLEDAVYQACYTAGSVTLICDDGEPYTTVIDIPKQKSGLSASKYQEIANTETKQILTVASQMQAKTKEVDTLKAIQAASRSLRAAVAETENVKLERQMIICDSCLSTTGSLSFSDYKLSTVSSEDIVSRLKELKEIPVLDDISVTVYTCGDTAGEKQKPLTQANRENLREIWKAVLEAGNAEVNMKDDLPLSATYDENQLPEVSAVTVMEDAKNIKKETEVEDNFADDGVISFDQTTIAFKEGTAELADKEAAAKALGYVSEYMKGHPDFQLMICGTTACWGGEEYCRKLSADRAGAVSDLLTEKLDVDMERLKITGVGYSFLDFYTYDQTPDGKLDEQIAPVNRTVKLLDLSSDTAKSILAME